MKTFSNNIQTAINTFQISKNGKWKPKNVWELLKMCKLIKINRNIKNERMW